MNSRFLHRLWGFQSHGSSGSIIELCLDEILSGLEGVLPSQKKKLLNISEKESLGGLIPLAVNYEIIDNTMKEKLEKFNPPHRSQSLDFLGIREKRSYGPSDVHMVFIQLRDLGLEAK